LAELRLKRDRIAQNLALAENADEHKAIAAIFEQVRQEEKALELQLVQAEQAARSSPALDDEIAAALADFDRLVELAADDTNLGLIGELFRKTNVTLFLSFEEVQPNKRKINQIAGGVVTFGTSPPPVTLYEGPTGRRALEGKVATPRYRPELSAVPVIPCAHHREGQSLGNVNRGDRI
jgi:hypothetical protein